MQYRLPRKHEGVRFSGTREPCIKGTADTIWQHDLDAFNVSCLPRSSAAMHAQPSSPCCCVESLALSLFPTAPPCSQITSVFCILINTAYVIQITLYDILHRSSSFCCYLSFLSSLHLSQCLLRTMLAMFTKHSSSISLVTSAMFTKYLLSACLLINTVFSQCPDYSDYSQEHHVPFSSGQYNLSYQRPTPACRTFNSSAVESAINSTIANIADPDLARLFLNSYPNTLDTAIKWKGYAANNSDEELTFVITGDIDVRLLPPLREK